MISPGLNASRCAWKNIYNKIIHHAFSSSHLVSAAKSHSRNEPRDKWNYNIAPFGSEPNDEHKQFKLVDANELENETTPPRAVKMLARDFIEDSLYNPHYGYFPKQATIFDTQNTSFNFNTLRNSVEFQEEIGRKYASYGADKHDGPGRQLWHTPTELFKVHYYYPLFVM